VFQFVWFLKSESDLELASSCSEVGGVDHVVSPREVIVFLSIHDVRQQEDADVNEDKEEGGD
jgi:hypothetical protein